MKVRFLVPRRSDGGWRDQLWAFCRSHWERAAPGIEIVEGVHDDGPFNRSAATNRAAAGDWDVGVVIDADVLLEADRVRQAVRRSVSTGRVVLPFTSRVSVTRPGTERLLRGQLQLPPTGYTAERQNWNVSTCVVVPRRTWDEIGGFDERFEGWGGEDDAFHAAARALAGVDRIEGPAWHLWHERSGWRRNGSLYRQSAALADRYCALAGVDRRRPGAPAQPYSEAMRTFLAEDRGPDQIVVICLTNGARPKELERTIRSFETNVVGPIGRRLIVGDRCAPRFPGWETTSVAGGSYRVAMAAAQARAIGSGQPWVFWLEDDWEFNRPIDLGDFQQVMNGNPQCVQMSLQRQAWYQPEKKAGGVFQTAPGLFRQEDGWVSHRRYWTQNPMLTRRSVLAEHLWPQVAQSEWRWAELILTDKGRVAGVWGSLDDAPWVTHLGVRRAGASAGY